MAKFAPVKTPRSSVKTRCHTGMHGLTKAQRRMPIFHQPILTWEQAQGRLKAAAEASLKLLQARLADEEKEHA